MPQRLHVAVLLGLLHDDSMKTADARELREVGVDDLLRLLPLNVQALRQTVGREAVNDP